MSKKKPRIIPEKIHLVSTQIFKANLDTAESFLEAPQKLSRFNFGVAKEIAYHLEQNMTRYRLYFTLEAHDDNDEPLGVTVEYGIEFHFKVENLNDFAKELPDGSMQLDAAMGATLLGIAFSTARGIIFERTRGTFFDGVILPVVDPFKVLEAD
jgi:hypothetical protein